MLRKYDLAAEDPPLYQALQSVAFQGTQGSTAGERTSCWRARGPGPVALRGGTWINSVVLGPEFRVTSGRASAVKYTWSPAKLGEWASHCEVRLMLLDAEAKSSWVMDVTTNCAAAVIVPVDVTMSANCLAILQLKAGDRVGRLLRPPFIKTVGVEIFYKY